MGNSEKCPHGCGLSYRRLNTGLRYEDVYELLKVTGEWKYKRRHTVLGKWFEIKQQMWDYHCNEGGCELDPRNVAAQVDVSMFGPDGELSILPSDDEPWSDDDEVPF